MTACTLLSLSLSLSLIPLPVLFVLLLSALGWQPSRLLADRAAGPMIFPKILLGGEGGGVGCWEERERVAELLNCESQSLWSGSAPSRVPPARGTFRRFGSKGIKRRRDSSRETDL